MKNIESRDVVLAFWDAMRGNDFYKAAEWLAEDFEGYWPQSSELIVGRKNFGDVNSFYPANGEWAFQLNDIVVEGNRVVTDVSISDGVQKARAITFHTIENGLIRKQVEFWPDDYDAPEWRRQWVEIKSDFK